MSVVVNVAFVGLLIPVTTGLPPQAGRAVLYALLFITQSSDHVKIKDTSYLINGMSRDIWIRLGQFGSKFPNF